MAFEGLVAGLFLLVAGEVGRCSMSAGPSPAHFPAAVECDPLPRSFLTRQSPGTGVPSGFVTGKAPEALCSGAPLDIQAALRRQVPIPHISLP